MPLAWKAEHDASALQIGAVAPAELRSVAAPSATSIVIPRAVWKSTFVCECHETASIACASTTTSDAFASLGRVSVSVFTSASVSIGSSGARRSGTDCCAVATFTTVPFVSLAVSVAEASSASVRTCVFTIQ